MTDEFDLIVLGSGGGGSTGAHHASAVLGKKVAIVEKDTVGGECPNFACVPTKALLLAAETYETVVRAGDFGVNTGKVMVDYQAVKRWKNLVVSRTDAQHGQQVFKSEHIKLVKGEARFLSPYEIAVGDQRYKAHRFLIATGTTVAIPPIPGLKEAGFVTFKEAVNFDKLPASIFILGGGPVGCEFAQIFTAFGVKVMIADLLPRLLAREDAEVGNFVEALFKNRGIKVLTNTAVAEVEKKDDEKIIHYTTNGLRHQATVEEILIATGKIPVVDLGLEAAGVKFDKHGVKVNQFLQTSQPHIYAAGDVVGPYLFTHTAEYQSFLAARNAFSYRKEKADYRVVPRCVFISPEVASVGITEEDSREKKIPVKKGITPIAVLGRANTENTPDGFVKVLTDRDETIIGAAVVSPRAGEVIHELALAIKLRAKAADLASMIHAYPTYSEAVKIACGQLEEVK